MKRIIWGNKSYSKTLASAFGVSYQFVSKALRFEANGLKAQKIRQAAVQQYGGKEVRF